MLVCPKEVLGPNPNLKNRLQGPKNLPVGLKKLFVLDPKLQKKPKGKKRAKKTQMRKN